ncbi:hypothetical protein PPSIR1_23229 [Plesiocystis pacifica SIR-1]|uniref:Uncharacterized protein n=1 Tax=Plesiocystis pacifica SIR-1 TaxID=391625 RepID=A6GC70_9BACT|nr:hypothetical protein [Plesiocystis pacifica]EDM76519.1 hypothetical protein PPSIR1_23229 [Plesiocystis pacifica SIR-1]
MSRSHATLTFAMLFATACAAGTSDQETFMSVSVDDDEAGTEDTETAGTEVGEESTETGTAGETDTSTESESESESESTGAETTEGSTEGTSTEGSTETGEPECTRSRYRYSFNNGSWEEVPLSQVWTGANAPPCSVEPRGVTYFEEWDQLFVFGADDMFYHRIQGQWQTPEPMSDSFGVIAGLDIDDAAMVPEISPQEPARINFSKRPFNYIYEVYENGSAVYMQTMEVADAQPPGAPLASVDRNWDVAWADPALIGQDPEWLIIYLHLDNDMLYRFDAGFQWMSWPELSNPIFTGDSSEPDPDGLESGWGTRFPRQAFFVGPSGL